MVTFLPKDSYDACVSAQGSNNYNALKPCNTAVFNINGFEVNPTESYTEYIKKVNDVAILATFVDNTNRTWNTSLELGQVYGLTAYSQINGTQVKISFQYGFNAPATEEIQSFFNQILSTFKFLDQPTPALTP